MTFDEFRVELDSPGPISEKAETILESLTYLVADHCGQQVSGLTVINTVEHWIKTNTGPVNLVYQVLETGQL